MKARPFHSDVSVSELSLGTWGLCGDACGPVSDAVQDEVIARARAYGVTLYETADVYARGGMEQRLGRLLGDDKEALIVTKIGTDMAGSPARKRFDPEYLRAACQASGERLRRPRIDVVLLHNPTIETLERGEATATLVELKQAGQIAAWGVSAGSAGVAGAALARDADVIEIAYNVFHGDLETLDWTTRRVGVLARSVLAHGLLCGQWAETKVFTGSDHRSERWTQEQLRGRLRQLSAVSGVLNGDVATLRAAALRFVLSNSSVSSAVLGPRSRVQLDQLVREAGKGPAYLAAASVQRIKDQLARQGVGR